MVAAVENAAPVALVVGGTRRIGRWASEALLEDGWQVIAAYRRDKEAAEAWRREQAKKGAQASPPDLWQVDFADSVQVAESAGRRFGPAPATLDLLVCAGGPSASGPLSETSPLELEALWRGNLLLVHNAVQLCLPALRRSQRGARIVLFSVAGAGRRAFRDIPAYAACKAMLESYARSLARELAPAAIAVNCVALGVTELPPEGAPLYGAEKLPAGRPVNAEDLQALLRYLAGPQASQLTGAILPLSGGFGL